MKRVTRWTLALGLAAGLGIGAPSAAWAKDPEPGATLKEKMVKDAPGETLKDAPDAESRRKGGGRGTPGGECGIKETLGFERRADGKCYG